MPGLAAATTLLFLAICLSLLIFLSFSYKRIKSNLLKKRFLKIRKDYPRLNNLLEDLSKIKETVAEASNERAEAKKLEREAEKRITSSSPSDRLQITEDVKKYKRIKDTALSRKIAADRQRDAITAELIKYAYSNLTTKEVNIFNNCEGVEW